MKKEKLFTLREIAENTPCEISAMLMRDSCSPFIAKYHQVRVFPNRFGGDTVAIIDFTGTIYTVNGDMRAWIVVP
jgi:hypothetical protein